MPPRTLEEIIPSLSTTENGKDIPTSFITCLVEIYSHPKEEISKAITGAIDDAEIFLIREKLFQNFLEMVPIENQKAAKLITTASDTDFAPSLRKRYKASTCYDDLHILAISIIEKSAHKEILKVLVPSSAPASSSQQNAGAPSMMITPAETQLIKEMHEMKRLMVEIRKENKDLKSQLNLVSTKVDKQTDLIKKLQQQNPDVRSNTSAPSSLPSRTWANSVSATSFGASPFGAPALGAPPFGAPPLGASGGAIPKKPFSGNSNASNGLAQNQNNIIKVCNNGSVQNKNNFPQNMANTMQSHPNPPTNQHFSHGQQVDEEGFERVRRKYPRKPPVFGTKNKANNKSMAGEKSDQVFSLFIGGVSNDYSEADLGLYMKDELQIIPISILVNKINAKNRSYKVTVPKKDKDNMFKPENWEENIIIKPFRVRNQTNGDGQNGDGRRF